MSAPPEPPFVLDGARVLRYAVLAEPRGGERASFVVEGISLDTNVVRGVAIAENLVDGRAFLLHCNADWQTVAAAEFADAQAARRAAEEAYAGVGATWHEFRPLTEAEAREVETTRAFLREIAADDSGMP